MDEMTEKQEEATRIIEAIGTTTLNECYRYSGIKSVFYGLKTQNNMDIKLKYRAFVGEKHADISSHLINSDIETFATEFAEWLVKNYFITDVVGRSENFICR